MSEELLIRHCSPTLAGIKTANMFSYCFNSKSEMQDVIRKLNRVLSKKGLRVIPLSTKDGRTLIYVFRPNKLMWDLRDNTACNLLQDIGYSPCNVPGCINHLIKRLNESDVFPHEIGLFLGYPPLDVKGFIENKEGTCKCVGTWKVYSDEEKAIKTFERYKKCTDVYSRLYADGKPIEKLAVAV